MATGCPLPAFAQVALTVATAAFAAITFPSDGPYAFTVTASPLLSTDARVVAGTTLEGPVLVAVEVQARATVAVAVTV